MRWQPGVTIEMMERSAIEDALQYFHGDKDAAASALGISSKTIYNKLEKYELQRDAEERKRAEEASTELEKRQRLAQKPGGSSQQAVSMWGEESEESKTDKVQKLPLSKKPVGGKEKVDD